SDKWRKYLRLKKEDVRKAYAGFDKYSYWTVLFCRMIPLIRSPISIPAGLSKLKFGLLLTYTAVGTLIWNVLLVSVGAAVGSFWEKIVAFMVVYSNIAYGIIGAGLIVFFIWFMRRRKRAS